MGRMYHGGGNHRRIPIQSGQAAQILWSPPALRQAAVPSSPAPGTVPGPNACLSVEPDPLLCPSFAETAGAPVVHTDERMKKLCMQHSRVGHLQVGEEEQWEDDEEAGTEQPESGEGTEAEGDDESSGLSSPPSSDVDDRPP
ncbi:hypothetical protein FN846DRAFT_886179 [Sphaerosporella brunnea]|uniref:Uncharacterized protein n=1 Tax=Sphaerosporella brunnea TaxID=1250544 RepID=A0A5J5FB15_9PEZI|nr:hypothetical protein FN846DRAFT_886179 [Sphaerosporella brunnea]